MHVLLTRCVSGIKADEDRCRELLDRSTALATALSPYIGYAATAEIAKEAVATGRPIRDLVRERGLLTDLEVDSILSADAMTTPGVPGRTRAAAAADRAGGASVRRTLKTSGSPAPAARSGRSRGATAARPKSARKRRP